MKKKNKNARYIFSSDEIISSKFDDYFIPIEKKNNLSEHIFFPTFIKLLKFTNIQIEYNTEEKLYFKQLNNNLLMKQIEPTVFKQFMENLKSENEEMNSFSQYSNYHNNAVEDNTTFWISFFSSEFEYLNCYHAYTFGQLQVLHIIPFLLLWCSGLIMNKYKALFFSLSEKNGKLNNKKLVEDIITELIVISSIGLYDTSHQIKKNFTVKDQKNYIMSEIYKYEYIKQLTDEIINKIFKGKTEISYKEFESDNKTLFSTLFNTKWIRNQLEKKYDKENNSKLNNN